MYLTDVSPCVLSKDLDVWLIVCEIEDTCMYVCIYVEC